jgi:hypothetical protein
MCLPTPTKTVQKPQTSLQTKARAEPAYRFYALWDKVCRSDVIEEAYRHCRANGGASGIDGISFDKIGAQGRKQWLEGICARSYSAIMPRKSEQQLILRRYRSRRADKQGFDPSAREFLDQQNVIGA